jgi:hypothetical protein
MDEFEIIEMNNNKWNEKDGPNLAIFDEGHAVKHSGPDGKKLKILFKFNNFLGWNTIRAILPFPSFNSGKLKIAYFEVQILK